MSAHGIAPIDLLVVNLYPFEATVAKGLKQALEVGTDRAVGKVGSVDGYLGNALLRIALPSELQDIAAQLRSFGLGAKVDELEVARGLAAFMSVVQTLKLRKVPSLLDALARLLAPIPFSAK